MHTLPYFLKLFFEPQKIIGTHDPCMALIINHAYKGRQLQLLKVLECYNGTIDYVNYFNVLQFGDEAKVQRADISSTKVELYPMRPGALDLIDAAYTQDGEDEENSIWLYREEFEYDTDYLIRAHDTPRERRALAIWERHLWAVMTAWYAQEKSSVQNDKTKKAVD